MTGKYVRKIVIANFTNEEQSRDRLTLLAPPPPERELDPALEEGDEIHGIWV